ncbi:MAG: response regulator [Caulobacteraceae bacterium]|nr:response regulator [Caulobacteraceae bacterium]
MLEYLSRLLDTHTLSPHGFCLLWRPELLWTHVVSDALIFAAYMTIPAALGVIIHKRRDVPFGWMVMCFALFITACGFTHLMGIWTLWRPDYGLEALVKAVTAVASIGTAIALWTLIPLAVSLPSPAALRAVNEELRRSIAERDLAIAELQNEKAQRQRSEQALLQSQKMDALGQLSGGMAHDFNNLLQAVQGSLELIKRRAADVVKVQQLAENAIEATERGSRLTAQLLAFARSKQLKVEPFILSDFIVGTRDLVARAAGSLIDLRFDLGSEDLCVQADRTQLELALLNLVINARDAMPGGGWIVVRTRKLEVVMPDPDLAPGLYVELSVVDTGPGMTPEVRTHAFDPFFTTKPVGQGTGLGLAQAYGVVKQAGGVARIESLPGEGACVSLFLPATLDSQPPVVRPAKPFRRRRMSGLVLVVDDDNHVREFVAGALDSFGLAVIGATDGQQGVDAVRSAKPDLVLMDYAMPGMTGAEAARLVAEERPDLRVVFMTGYADSEALAAVLGHDAEVLRKPFRMEDLAEAVEKALRAPSGA